MTLTHAIQKAVQARPGMTSREVADMINGESRSDIARISALLVQCWQRGKLHRTGKGRAYRYYPTDKTCIDQRSVRNKPSAAAARKRQATREARAKKKAQRQAQPPPAKTPPAAKPSNPLAFRIVEPARPKPQAATARKAETVADFLAAGGQIQRLPPHFSANPLRFDHSDAASPIGRRRPVPRTRPHATHA